MFSLPAANLASLATNTVVNAAAAAIDPKIESNFFPKNKYCSPIEIYHLFLKGIARKFNKLATDGTIKPEDGIHLVRAIGENPSKKEYKTACEELMLANKEKLDLKGFNELHA